MDIKYRSKGYYFSVDIFIVVATNVNVMYFDSIKEFLKLFKDEKVIWILNIFYLIIEEIIDS